MVTSAVLFILMTCFVALVLPTAADGANPWSLATVFRNSSCWISPFPKATSNSLTQAAASMPLVGWETPISATGMAMEGMLLRMVVEVWIGRRRGAAGRDDARVLAAVEIHGWIRPFAAEERTWSKGMVSGFL
jgi:hypothetical protein